MINETLNLIAACFQINNLTLTISSMISLIGCIIMRFSSSYMQSYPNKKRYQIKISLLICCTILLVNSANIIALVATLMISNLLLTSIMLHNDNWLATIESRNLALKYLLTVCFLITLGLSILSLQANSILLDKINALPSSLVLYTGLTLVTLGCLIQSALWPFNKWLLNSLNSPTPTSAIMHAGLINGGGIILIKLYPAFIGNQEILDLIFIAGLITALLGTYFKLIQSGYKNILACSTMGQMGFMFAQIGAGLLPAAITHLICHSFFKAHLFLGHGNQAYTSYLSNTTLKNTLLVTIQSLLIGAIASSCFYLAIFGTTLNLDTSIILYTCSFVLSSHLAHQVINSFKTLGKGFTFALPITVGVAILHSAIIKFFETIINIETYTNGIELDLIHIIGSSVLLVIWFCSEFININHPCFSRLEKLKYKLYVYGLNAAQPRLNTATSNRLSYRYI